MSSDASGQEHAYKPSHRLTVAEAAEMLGVTRDAVRKRIKRDSIRWETGSDGETYVYVDAAATHEDASSDASGQDAMHALVKSLEDQVRYLRREVVVWQEEARRKDHLLAAALERIPQIEAPPDTSSPGARGWPQTASEPRPNTQGPPEEGGRSWWRRWFSLG